MRKNRYGVVGNPVSHSLSPDIHSEFAKQTKRALTYEKILCDADEFNSTLNLFFNSGGEGLNITVPYKGLAAEWVDSLAGHAQKTRVVNTVVKRENGFEGYNTDGIGLMRDLKNKGVRLKGERVLVLGAGGAATGIIPQIANESPELLRIANRTLEKAKILSSSMSSLFPEKDISALAIGQLHETFDVVINATSAGIDGKRLPIAQEVVKTAFCYDLFYSQNRSTLTPFCSWATKSGAEGISDGLGMLVEQAAEAFYLWTGDRPSGAEALKRLETKLS